MFIANPNRMIGILNKANKIRGPKGNRAQCNPFKKSHMVMNYLSIYFRNLLISFTIKATNNAMSVPGIANKIGIINGPRGSKSQ